MNTITNSRSIERIKCFYGGIRPKYIDCTLYYTPYNVSSLSKFVRNFSNMFIVRVTFMEHFRGPCSKTTQLHRYRIVANVVAVVDAVIIAGVISILLWVYALFRTAIQFSWWIIELFSTTCTHTHTRASQILQRDSKPQATTFRRTPPIEQCKFTIHTCINYLFFAILIHHLDVRTRLQNQRIVYKNVFPIIFLRLRYVQRWCSIEIRCDGCTQMLQRYRRGRWK